MVGACALSLQGCAAVVALQAIPAVIRATAIALGDDPTNAPVYFKLGTDSMNEPDVNELDIQIRKAECGDPRAQYWLGTNLETNLRMSENNVQAFKWYSLAKAGNYEPAAEKIAGMYDTMSANEIGEAQILVRDWVPRTEGCTFEAK